MAPRKKSTGKKKPLNIMAKKATGGSKKPAKAGNKGAKSPSAAPIFTGGAVNARTPLPFNNALPAAGEKKTKKRTGKKENAGRRKARVAAGR